jgi:anti-sigma B factor antagonist
MDRQDTLIADGRERSYGSQTDLAGQSGVVAVSGVMDLHAAPRFKRDLDEAIALASGDVVLDLSDVDLIDSTSICVMAGALQSMQTQGRRLILVVPIPHVMRILTITGLQTAFPIVASRRQALRLAGARVADGAGARPPLGRALRRAVA